MRKGIALALAAACVSMAQYFDLQVRGPLAAGGTSGPELLPLSTQDGKAKLRESLKDTGLGTGWIYDDLDAGYAEARKSGKPMLVVFR